MKKFKIVFNGYNYRIKRRKWFFFWVFVRNAAYSSAVPIEYSNLQEAEDAIDKLNKKYAKYKDIVDRRDLPIWKSLTDIDDL